MMRQSKLEIIESGFGWIRSKCALTNGGAAVCMWITARTEAGAGATWRIAAT